MKKNRIISVIMAAMITAAMLTACTGTSPAETASAVYSESGETSSSENMDNKNEKETAAPVQTADDTQSKNSAVDSEEYFSERDLSAEVDRSSAVKITAADKTFTVEGSGASVSENILTISSAGTYIISGTASDGRIVVDAGDDDKIQIVFDNCSITSSSNSALNIKNADKVFITIPDGTKNTITDGKTYADNSDDSSVDSAIYSKCDLVINGSGELTVNGNMSHAIVSKDDLKLTGGTVTVNSVNSAISGKDSVRIANVKLNITSGGDGIKSTNEKDSDKGFVYIESGDITVNAENDAIQAESYVTVLNASINGETGGGSSKSTKTHTDDFGGRGMWGNNNNTSQSTDSSDTESAKGIKAGTDITFDGASVTLNCADDTLNAGGDVNIAGGTLKFASGDDGIHADENFIISGGTLTISESYEGIEAKSITVKGGEVDLTASDDGINATDGVSEGGMPGMGGMMGGNAASSDVYILISGGKLHVNAGGDGIDSNGTLTVEGGDVTVDGPTNSGNGALDAGSGSTISGGTVIAVGSSGMAETFTNSSTQASILYNFSQSHSAGETITLKDESGKIIAEYKAAKAFNSVVISTPDLKSSGKYTISAGSESASIEMTSVSYSNGGGMMGGGMMGGKRGNMMDEMPNGMPAEMPSDIPDDMRGMFGGNGMHGGRGGKFGGDMGSSTAEGSQGI